MAIDRSMRLHATGHLGHDVGVSIGDLVDFIKQEAMKDIEKTLLVELRAMVGGAGARPISPAS